MNLEIIIKVKLGRWEHEIGDVERSRHEELLPFPTADVVAVERRVLVDAPEALGAAGADGVGPEEAVAGGGDVEVAPPHRKRHVREVEAVRAVRHQLVQRVPLVRHLAHEPHRDLPVVRQRHLHLREHLHRLRRPRHRHPHHHPHHRRHRFHSSSIHAAARINSRTKQYN